MQRLLSAFALWILTVNSPLAFSQNQSIPVDLINLPEGFRIELLHSVAANEGSWVSLTHDPQGRLITSDQYGGLFRITPPAIGSKDAPKIEKLAVEMGHAQGLLYAFDSLYAVVNGKPFGKGPGLYRLRDTNNDDQFDEVSLLRSIEGGGEHGPHAVILSPNKKSLYVCGGNHTKIPNPEKSRVPRNWAEDQILPRMWDAGGHAVGRLAPGGWICKTDPDGKEWELISSGYRNEYDIAFNPEGDLFTYDADMEWDIGSPWYRPTESVLPPAVANLAGEAVPANGQPIIRIIYLPRSTSDRAAQPGWPLVPEPNSQPNINDHFLSVIGAMASSTQWICSKTVVATRASPRDFVQHQLSKGRTFRSVPMVPCISRLAVDEPNRAFTE